MAPPRLTFFCELETGSLQDLFIEQVINDLLDLKACVSLGILDLSDERAGIVQRLNRAGVPVVAWLLLPKSQGYWFNLDNAPQAADRYIEFVDWTTRFDLLWDGIGLDIEPNVRDVTQFAAQRWRVLPQLARRVVERGRLRPARVAYQNIVAQIQSDGYRVDSYQYPIIDDERKVGSTLLQRSTGIVNIRVDREVWKLYSSYLRPDGAGVIASYAPDAHSVGLGITDRGVETETSTPPPLTWDELARDLRLTWYWCEDIHIFSLEGCVEQGFLERMKGFAWDYPILLPEQSLTRVEGWRAALRSILWLSANITTLLIGLGAILVGWQLVKWLLARSRRLSS